jgi:hypothetical protein
MTLRFNDGVTMRINGAPQGSIAVPQGRQVAQAFEQGHGLALHFDNRTSVVVTLESPATRSRCGTVKTRCFTLVDARSSPDAQR